MVNSQVVAEIVDAFKLDRLQDNIPSPVPVIEVGVKSTKNSYTISQTSSNTSATVLTTSDTNNTYITGVMLSVIKDSSATSTSSRVRCSQGGVYKDLAIITGITLTAQQDTTAITFNHPVLVDKNTAVTLTNSTNTAVVFAGCIVNYYIDEVN